jgi:hypothetical protein
MFRDRDLFLLGAGALLSALCLLLPLPFTWKLVAGVLTLVGFMALALLRLGPDRISVEEWLLRRLRFWLSPRRFVYHQPGWKPPAQRTSPSEPAEANLRPLRAPWSGFRPVALALPERGIYTLVTVFLSLLGTYFIAWLAQGGAEEIAAIFR